MGLFSRFKLTGSVTELAGVDIGTSSITVCVLRGAPDSLQISHMARKTFQEDLLNEGNIIDKEMVGGEIRKLFSDHGIRCPHAACSLSSYVVITKVVTLPFLEGEAFEKNISAEVENAIPFPLNDVHYSYYVMGMDEVKQDMVNVQVAAAKKDIVEGYIQAFDLAGLNLQVIDIDVFGIANMVEQIYFSKETSVMAVDIGAATTNIAILKGDSIQFTREILLGGNTLTRQIERSEQIAFFEAEAKKVAADSSVAHLFEDFIYSVSSEINKTINFYISIKPREMISKIYLTGGSSLLKGLKEQVAEDTKVEVEYLNPFLMLSGAPESLPDYDLFKPFGAVALYLSSRISDFAK
jgi:type IV pilus assembly protein PilM